MIIALYGLDGAGKTTQAELLSDRLRKSGKSVVMRNPFQKATLSKKLIDYSFNRDMSYEDYWGGKIVGTLLLEDVWDNTIECLSSTQDITVFDRYYIDFLVYSPILGSDISFQQPILDAFPKASLNFYLDELPQVCYERIWNRSREKNLYVCKREDLSVLSQARDAFLKIAKSIPEYYIIQSTGKTADLISKEIWNITTQYLR